MTVGNKLLNNFPKTVNKSGELFGAIVANSKGSGVFESVLNELFSFMEEWTSNSNVYEQTGYMLKLTATFISFFEQYTDESDAAYKKRIEAIFVRNNSQLWGTNFDTYNVFKSYFGNAKIYIVENVNHVEDDNYLGDYDFEEKDGSWTGISEEESNCYYSKNARFCKSCGVQLNRNGSFYQDIELNTDDIAIYHSLVGDTFESLAKQYYGAEEKADYIKLNNPAVAEPIPEGTTINIPAFNVMFLHFFLKGKCNVRIKNSAGEYWNPTSNFTRSTGEWTFGGWQTEIYDINKVSMDDWRNQTIMFMADNTVEGITVEFVGTAESGCIDYTRLFKKEPYASFTVIIHYQNMAESGENAALFPGSKDETITKAIKSASYFNGSYMYGSSSGGFAQDLYDDLLRYVHAEGVKTYLELANMDN